MTNTRMTSSYEKTAVAMAHMWFVHSRAGVRPGELPSTLFQRIRTFLPGVIAIFHLQRLLGACRGQAEREKVRAQITASAQQYFLEHYRVR